MLLIIYIVTLYHIYNEATRDVVIVSLFNIKWDPIAKSNKKITINKTLDKTVDQPD